LALNNELLLSNLLQHNVRCDQGIDHGQGIMPWMYPPSHRLLGWATKPSNLRLTRDVWRLDQLKGINSQEVYVKGIPATSDQETLNRFPTLLEADLINKNGVKIAILADFVFQVKTGKISYYLVSRSNPKIPGTSRWRLSINNIKDQQPGLVFTDFLSLEDLPIIKSSLRQNLLLKSEKVRSRFKEISLRANGRLEGWLEDIPLHQEDFSKDSSTFNLFDDWEDSVSRESSNYLNDSFLENDPSMNEQKNNGDPWI